MPIQQQGGVRVLEPQGRRAGALQINVCRRSGFVGWARVQFGVPLDDQGPRAIDNLCRCSPVNGVAAEYDVGRAERSGEEAAMSKNEVRQGISVRWGII